MTVGGQLKVVTKVLKVMLTIVNVMLGRGRGATISIVNNTSNPASVFVTKGLGNSGFVFVVMIKVVLLVLTKIVFCGHGRWIAIF